jgi:hypothetical protein
MLENVLVSATEATFLQKLCRELQVSPLVTFIIIIIICTLA